ncbi:MAG: BatD family protein [Chthoniobacterales bacterium]
MKSPLIVRAFASAMLLWCAGVAAAGEVVEVLSSNTTRVGEPVILIYRFTNTAQPSDMPRPTINVPGLDIRFNGVTSQSRQSFTFGGRGAQRDASSVYEFMYVVTPNQPGRFTIPGFGVSVGGRLMRTKALTLTVTGSGGYVPPSQQAPVQQVIPPPFQPQGQLPPAAQARPPRPSAPSGQGRTPPVTSDGEAAPYFGEIVIGNRSAYVGEVVPVELRFYFRVDVGFNELQRPTFGGDGFTAAPLTEPEQTEQLLENTPYNVVTFRSAITPVKVGKIEIPPASMEGRMITAGAPPGMDPFFNQFFGNLPMPGFGRAEVIEVRTGARTLEVKALPTEGRPDNFAGAIGQFTLRAQAAPKKTGVGEPVTLSLAVEGRGNFEAVSAPELTGEDGWRVYAPKESFTSTDSAGFGESSGTKTFDIAMVARRDQTSTPGAEFSYFDPQKKNYVTLKADPVPVTALGGGPAPEEAGATVPVGGEAAQLPAVPTGPADVAAPARALTGPARGFAPRLLDQGFHLLNLLLLAAVILSIPFLLWQRRRARKSARTAESESLVRQAKSVWQKTSDPAEFFTAAAQFVQARLALLDDRPAALVDTDEALTRRVPDAAERRELQSLLARRDELKYGGSGGAPLDPAERRRLAGVLEKFASNHV